MKLFSKNLNAEAQESAGGNTVDVTATT
ncbi:MAG: hypothetical protein RIR55_1670, partial [Bacteroidota bacterium]